MKHSTSVLGEHGLSTSCVNVFSRRAAGGISQKSAHHQIHQTKWLYSWNLRNITSGDWSRLAAASALSPADLKTSHMARAKLKEVSNMCCYEPFVFKQRACVLGWTGQFVTHFHVSLVGMSHGNESRTVPLINTLLTGTWISACVLGWTGQFVTQFHVSLVGMSHGNGHELSRSQIRCSQELGFRHVFLVERDNLWLNFMCR